LNNAISQALFGKLPAGSITRPEIPDHTRYNSSNEDETATKTERYSRLDTRFDVDVDDEQAPKRGSAGEAGNPLAGRSVKKEATAQRALPDFNSILARLSPAGYSELVRSKTDAGKPFVRFERAVVIEMKSGAAVDRAAIERVITDEVRARFVVAGVDPKLGWQDEASVRHLAQSLLEQGAAYSISGKYLVFASNKEFARDILQAASTPALAPATKIDGALEFYSLISVAEARPVFDKLMSKLDGKEEKSAANQDQDEESSSTINFFSDNISSLISASTIREVRLHREVSGAIATERILYSW
jgi:hypothetical protein